MLTQSGRALSGCFQQLSEHSDVRPEQHLKSSSLLQLPCAQCHGFMPWLDKTDRRLMELMMHPGFCSLLTYKAIILPTPSQTLPSLGKNLAETFQLHCLLCNPFLDEFMSSEMKWIVIWCPCLYFCEWHFLERPLQLWKSRNLGHLGCRVVPILNWTWAFPGVIGLTSCCPPESEPNLVNQIPQEPLLIFINSKSCTAVWTCAKKWTTWKKLRHVQCGQQFKTTHRSDGSQYIIHEI